MTIGQRDGGYLRQFGRVEELIKAAQHDIAQKTSIANTTPTTGTPLSMESENKKVEKPIHLTDISAEARSISQPQLNEVPVLDVNKTVDAAPPNPASARQEQNQCIEQYQEVNAKAMTQLFDAVKDVDRQVGDKLQALCAPSSGGSTLWDTMKAANPAGDIYTVISTLMNQPNNDRVTAALDKALTNLQAQTTQQNELASRGKASPPPFDWNKFQSPKQLMAFIERDITKDPFMLKAAENETQVAQMEANFKNYEEVYAKGGQKVTTDMMLSARDNKSLLETLARGDDEKVQQIVVKGKLDQKPRVAETADEVLANATIGEIKGVKLKMPDISDLGEKVKEAGRLAYMPPKPTNIADGPTMAGLS